VSCQPRIPSLALQDSLEDPDIYGGYRPVTPGAATLYAVATQDRL
jgi:hypothetical protein